MMRSKLFRLLWALPFGRALLGARVAGPCAICRCPVAAATAPAEAGRSLGIYRGVLDESGDWVCLPCALSLSADRRPAGAGEGA